MLLLRYRCAIAPLGNGGFELPKCSTLSELPNPLSSKWLGVGEFVENCCLSGVFIGVAVIVVSAAESSSPHDRSSERPLRNDLRNLSTRRMWNLLRLPWLPPVGFGGLQPVLVLVGLVNELCDVRDEVREKGRELVRLMGIWRAGEDT